MYRWHILKVNRHRQGYTAEFKITAFLSGETLVRITRITALYGGFHQFDLSCNLECQHWIGKPSFCKKIQIDGYMLNLDNLPHQLLVICNGAIWNYLIWKSVTTILTVRKLNVLCFKIKVKNSAGKWKEHYVFFNR